MSFATISGRTSPLARKITSVMLGAALMVGASFSAHADPVLTFSFNLGTYGLGSGTLLTDNYVPTDGSLTFNLETFELVLPVTGTPPSIDSDTLLVVNGPLNFTNLSGSGTTVSFSGATVTWTGDQEATGTVQFNVVPEPASLALLGIGLVGIGLSRRKRA